jgi:hypothetical protein
MDIWSWSYERVIDPRWVKSLIRVIQAEWTYDPDHTRVIDPRWVKSLIRVIQTECAYDPDHTREWSIQGELNH